MTALPLSSRVLVVGAAGRLGRVVCEELTGAGHSLIALTRSDLDITQGGSVERAISDAAPHVVINCVAFNDVDGAESDRATAFAVNANGPALLARAAVRAGALFVHYSTDFVFDGTARRPYAEDDPVNPLSAYGASKQAGEVEVRGAIANHYILRVESLFGGTGVGRHRATIDYIADTLIEGGTVRAFVDRTVSPSYVPDIATATRELLVSGAPSGTYHCVSTGMTTWFDIAQNIARYLGSQGRVEGATSSDAPGKARRPRFCALSNEKLRAIGIAMPDWQSTIARHLQRRTATTPPLGTR